MAGSSFQLETPDFTSKERTLEESGYKPAPADERNMKRIMLGIIIILFSPSLIFADDIWVTIITPGVTARLCPKPDCGQGQELLRIPENTKLEVTEKTTIRIGGTIKWDVIWYKVKYQNKEGWISEFNTDFAPQKPQYR